MQGFRIRGKSLTIPLALLLLGGCGSPGPDYGKLDLSDAEGRVTLDGQPLGNALVLFESADQTFSFAMTDASGHYRVMFNSEKAGVTKGPKTVRIWSARGVPGMAGAVVEEDPDARSTAAERVPARYNTQSELVAVVDDDSHTFDFDLKSS